MRSILFVQYTNPDYYPTSVHAARWLAGSGFKVTMCGVDDWPVQLASYGAGVDIVRLQPGTRRGAFSPLRFSRFVMGVRQVARRARPDVIVGYDMHGLVAAGIVGRAAGVPWIYHCYDVLDPSEALGSFDRVLRPAERY